MLKKALYLSISVAVISVTASAQPGERGQGHGYGHGYSQSQNSNTSVELSVEAQESLVYLLEEEKVARDVYLKLYQTWGSRVFKNISKSEQKHMNAILRLVKKYNLEVPSTLNSVGDFKNEELQLMYTNLVEKGELSLTDALEVGVEVEETDIEDLQAQIDAPSTTSRMRNVYNNLLNASYKHLNAFTRQLTK